jgi:hypothetical protein
MSPFAKSGGAYLMDAAPTITTTSVRVLADLLCLFVWPAYTVAQLVQPGVTTTES